MTSYYFLVFCFISSITILFYLQLDIGSGIIHIPISKGWKDIHIVGARLVTIALLVLALLIHASAAPLLRDLPAALSGKYETHSGIVDFESISRVPLDGFATMEFININGNIFIRAFPVGEKLNEANRYRITYLSNSRYILGFEQIEEKISGPEK